MSAVLIAAHNDDETLWTFYNLLRHKPRVIVVLRSWKEAAMGGPDYQTREQETEQAMRVAGVEWEQWKYTDLDPEWRDIAWDIGAAIRDCETVIGPAWELGGHEHHNEIASILHGYIYDEYIAYTSYVRGSGRTDTGTEVVPTVEERILKDVALACYKSQAVFPPTAPWFGSDQREFVL